LGVAPAATLRIAPWLGEGLVESGTASRAAAPQGLGASGSGSRRPLRSEVLLSARGRAAEPQGAQLSAPRSARSARGAAAVELEAIAVPQPGLSCAPLDAAQAALGGLLALPCPSGSEDEEQRLPPASPVSQAYASFLTVSLLEEAVEDYAGEARGFEGASPSAMRDATGARAAACDLTSDTLEAHEAHEAWGAACVEAEEEEEEEMEEMEMEEMDEIEQMEEMEAMEEKEAEELTAASQPTLTGLSEIAVAPSLMAVGSPLNALRAKGLAAMHQRTLSMSHLDSAEPPTNVGHLQRAQLGPSAIPWIPWKSSATAQAPDLKGDRGSWPDFCTELSSSSAAVSLDLNRSSSSAMPVREEPFVPTSSSDWLRQRAAGVPKSASLGALHVPKLRSALPPALAGRKLSAAPTAGGAGSAVSRRG